MKKLLALLLCTVSISAFAVDYGIGVQYDYDGYSANSARLKQVSKKGLVVGARTEYGQFDAVMYDTQIRGEGYVDNSPGAELGYSLAYAFSNKISVNSRVAHGRIFGRGLGAPQTTADYTTLTVGVGFPITKQFGLGAGYRHRFEGDLTKQDQFTLGGTYAFDKHYSLRANLVHNKSAGRSSNGLAFLMLYVF